jgi:tetratricopeptide (TPR) repeat protein
MIDARASDLIARADELMNSGDAIGALNQYEQAMAADPANGEAVAGLASALGELGRRAEGVERLHRAAGARDWDARGLVWLALGLLTLDQADQARELARKATEQREEEWRGDGALATELAWVWIGLGDARQGLAVLDAAATAIGTDARAHWTRGHFLAELDRHEEALAEYDAALATESEDAQVLLDSAFALRALGRGDQALDRARGSRRADGLDIRGRFRLVDLLDELGAPAEAGDVLDELTQIDAWKGGHAAAVKLAARLYGRNEPKKAIKVLDDVLADATWKASADANMAITWRALSLATAGDTTRAEADLETLDARGARTAEPGMRALAGFAEFAVGRRDAALAYFNGIADLVEDELRVPVLLQTGKALVQLGRLTEAVAPLRRAHSLAALPGGDPEAVGQAALFLEMALGGADRDEQTRLLDEADRLLPADNVQGRALLDLRRANRAVGDQQWDNVLALTDGLTGRLASLDRPVAHFLRRAIPRSLAEAE